MKKKHTKSLKKVGATCFIGLVALSLYSIYYNRGAEQKATVTQMITKTVASLQHNEQTAKTDEKEINDFRLSVAEKKESQSLANEQSLSDINPYLIKSEGKLLPFKGGQLTMNHLGDVPLTVGAIQTEASKPKTFEAKPAPKPIAVKKTAASNNLATKDKSIEKTKVEDKESALLVKTEGKLLPAAKTTKDVEGTSAAKNNNGNILVLNTDEPSLEVEADAIAREWSKKPDVAKTSATKMKPVEQSDKPAEKDNPELEQGVFSLDDGEFAHVSINDAPEAITKLLMPEDQIVKAFRTINNLNAWVVKQRGFSGATVVYLTTADDLFVLSGELLYKNEQGETADLNKQIAERYTYQVDATVYWDALEDTDYIHEGAPADSDKKKLYVFYDPNCRYCNLSWLSLRPYVDTKVVQLRWIPVAVLTASSKNKAAYIFESEDPWAEFTKGNLAWEADSNEGPFPLASDMTVETAFKIEKNNQFLRDFGITGSPAFIYKDEEGDVNVSSGSLRLSEIPTLLNTKEIVNYDPRLNVLR